MHRREFVMALGGALWVNARNLGADHHLVSDDPLIVTFDLASLTERYTETQDFYVRNHHAIPDNTSTAFFSVEGEVELPQKLTPDALSPLTQRKIGAVLECAGNPVSATGLVSDGLWTGWPLADVLSPARPKPAGEYVYFVGKDGYSRSVPIKRVLDSALLVTHLNGRPLPRRHGAPWRVLFPGWYGMDSVKWLERIVIAKTPLPPEGNAYLELRKDSAGAVEARPLPRIQVKSIITSPSDGAVVRRGKVDARGLAWSGSGRVSNVQLSANGGATWNDAALDYSGDDYDWTPWSASLRVEQVGPIEFVCRAVDAAGNTQPSQRDPQRLDLYSYNVYHRVRGVIIP